MTPLDIMMMRPRVAGGDADAAAWAAAVTANGGTYTQPQLAALSVFFAAMRADGLWPTKFSCFGPLWGSDLAAALVQWKEGVWAPATNVNFVSGDYSEATGLTGNGSSKYLKTGLTANALTLNDTHMALYNRASAGNGTMGSASGANLFYMLAPFASGGSLFSRQYDASGGNLNSTALGTPFGFLVGSRTASNAHGIYRNGSSLGTKATSGGTLPAAAVFVFAYNNGGTPTVYSGMAAGGYSIGSGLSAADVTAYNTHMQEFQTALGRNV